MRSGRWSNASRPCVQRSLKTLLVLVLLLMMITCDVTDCLTCTIKSTIAVIIIIFEYTAAAYCRTIHTLMVG